MHYIPMLEHQTNYQHEACPLLERCTFQAQYQGEDTSGGLPEKRNLSMVCSAYIFCIKFFLFLVWTERGCNKRFYHIDCTKELRY